MIIFYRNCFFVTVSNSKLVIPSVTLAPRL